MPLTHLGKAADLNMSTVNCNASFPIEIIYVHMCYKFLHLYDKLYIFASSCFNCYTLDFLTFYLLLLYSKYCSRYHLVPNKRHL